MAMRRSSRFSFVLVLSYLVDVIVIIAALIIAQVFSRRTPNKRPFSLGDPDISFPFTVHETVSTVALMLITCLVPAVIIALVSLFLVPGPTVPKTTPKQLIWQRKFWELFTGWLGLALSIAAAEIITNGLKNLNGRPRPDLLARCMPDLENISKYALTGFPITPENSVLVSAEICQNPDLSTLNDGFRSFPSGHSSNSAAGLVYLSLFLASKLAVAIPFLSPRAYSRDTSSYLSAFPSRIARQARQQEVSQNGSYENMPPRQIDPYQFPSGHDDSQIAARKQAAAPPLYLLVIAFIPTAVAAFVASSRFYNFRHHAFDILFGFGIGLLTSIFSFRLYHLPIRQGAGWAWGPRSRDRAFWSGIGRGGYVSAEGHSRYTKSGDIPLQDVDVEAGRNMRRHEATDENELLEQDEAQEPDLSFDEPRRLDRSRYTF